MVSRVTPVVTVGASWGAHEDRMGGAPPDQVLTIMRCFLKGESVLTLSERKTFTFIRHSNICALEEFYCLCNLHFYLSINTICWAKAYESIHTSNYWHIYHCENSTLEDTIYRKGEEFMLLNNLQ